MTVYMNDRYKERRKAAEMREKYDKITIIYSYLISNHSVSKGRKSGIYFLMKLKQPKMLTNAKT